MPDGASPSSWRDVLLHSSWSLKHIYIFFLSRSEEKLVSNLEFPNLEVLELFERDLEFPDWMEVPSTLKLRHNGLLHFRIPSVSQLWLTDLLDTNDGSTRCPLREVIMFEVGEDDSQHDTTKLLKLLNARRENVEAELGVEGIKMQAPKKLVIPFESITSEQLEEYRELVEEVVDWGSEPSCWEVVI